MGERIEVTTKSEEETLKVAYYLASKIKGNKVICLNGELGAGKTVFVRGFCSFFGINEISSPTFTLVNEYNGSYPIFHFDVYRLSHEDEFYEIGGEEYFDKGICLIEWGEKIQNHLPREYIKVAITKDTKDENKRTIEFIPIGERYNSLLSEVFK